jgi:NAD(P)-dependent dehydrogenase (short-subunit alcohol dehydrogenase family)
MSLQDKKVVVLGGTSGIGLAVANAAGAAGAQVVVASGSPERVGKALAALPAGSVGRVVDVTDPTALGTFFDEVGPFDHLAYTAGENLALMPLATLELDRARDFFNVRFFGALAAAQAAAPHLQPGGSITLTLGGAMVRPRPGWTVAASVLGAVDALTRALAVELAPIRVNAVSPGVIRSPLWDAMPADAREGLFAAVADSALVKAVGEVEDVAQAFVYCMTQRNATGSVVTVDGGSALV